MDRSVTIINQLLEDSLAASEAIYGFCGWLTSNEKPVTMSSHHACGMIVELINAFCNTNQLADPREDYHVHLKHPDTITNESTTRYDHGLLKEIASELSNSGQRYELIEDLTSV